MDESTFDRAFDLDDPAALASLSRLLRSWEPRLELYKPLRDAFLYEPDGTLYSIALRDGMIFKTDRRGVAVNSGDMVVVPGGHGVDAGDDVDLIAFRHDGPPPDHFRERFIQVWCFDHRPTPTYGTPNTGVIDIVAVSDVRLRIPYAVVDVNLADEAVVSASDEVVLLLGLNGQVAVEVIGARDKASIVLSPRHAVAVSPGSQFRLTGQGRVGLLTILNDLANVARVASHADSDKGPEYVPRQENRDVRADRPD